MSIKCCRTLIKSIPKFTRSKIPWSPVVSCQRPSETKIGSSGTASSGPRRLSKSTAAPGNLFFFNNFKRLVNNATSYARRAGDMYATKTLLSTSPLRRDIAVNEDLLNFIAFHNQQEQSVVKDFAETVNE